MLFYNRVAQIMTGCMQIKVDFHEDILMPSFDSHFCCFLVNLLMTYIHLQNIYIYVCMYACLDANTKSTQQFLRQIIVEI